MSKSDQYNQCFYVCHAQVPNLRKAKDLQKDLQKSFSKPDYTVTPLNTTGSNSYVTFSVVSNVPLDTEKIRLFEFQFVGQCKILFSHSSNTPLYVFSILGVHEYSVADRLQREPQKNHQTLKAHLALTGCQFTTKFTSTTSCICLTSPFPLRTEDIALVQGLLAISKATFTTAFLITTPT